MIEASGRHDITQTGERLEFRIPRGFRSVRRPRAECEGDQLALARHPRLPENRLELSANRVVGDAKDGRCVAKTESQYDEASEP